MRAIIQRVSSASVSVDGAVVAAIGKGMLVLLGVAGNDTTDDAQDEAGPNNFSRSAGRLVVH
ncbi:MAG: hypothetical protein EBZ77_15585 [Chitinophagia bacterium]|nr:hypothetical protein [Chitinophagia bacterium]